MAETKTVSPKTESTVTVDRTRDFWDRYNKVIIYAGLGILLIVVGYIAYKNFVLEPNEKKASEQIYRAEEYFRADSLTMALNGDGINPGFLKIIDKYGSTKSGNLAKYYAGVIYLQMGNYGNAIKYLNDFDTDAQQIQARAYKLLGDAYAEQGKNSEALSHYKKAGHHFEKDDVNSPEYLFLAGYFAETVMNDKKQAIELYKEVKENYPQSERGFEIDKYLARLGVYSDDDK